MSRILELANGVAELLSEYKAEVIFAPNFELHKMQDMRVVILPVAKEKKFLSRSSFDNVDSLDIGIIHKCHALNSVPALMELVENVGDMFIGARVGNSLCVKIKFDPLFDVSELKSRGVFIGIIRVDFKELA